MKDKIPCIKFLKDKSMWKSSPKQENNTIYLDDDIDILPGIGQWKEELFAAVGICTISDAIKLN